MKELKETAGDPDMDNNHFALIRNWVLDLSYGHEKLIAPVKRGAYQFSDKYNPEIIEKTVSKAERPDWVIGREDIYVAVNHLVQFNPILREQFGFEIKKDLVESVSEFAPDYSNIAGNEKAIWSAREAAMERVDCVFDNDDGLYKFLSVISEDSAEYKFVDCLIGLDNEQRSVLKKFMRSRPEIDRISEKQLEFWVIENGTKDVVAHATINVGERQDQATQLQDGDEVLLQTLSVQPEPRPEAVEREPEVLAEGSKGAPSAPAVSIEVRNGKNFSESELAKLSLLETVAYGTAATLMEHLHPDDTYTRQHIQNFFPKFSANRVATAKDNKVIPKVKHMKFTIEQVVRVVIYTDRHLQNIYRNKKYQQVVEDILSRAIRKAREAGERALAVES